MKKLKLFIEGMHCASCAANIERSLKKVKGVKSASVNFIAKKAYIEIDDKIDISEDELKKAVSNAGGYKAFSESTVGKETENKNNKENKTTIFLVQGLDNPHCAMTIEN